MPLVLQNRVKIVFSILAPSVLSHFTRPGEAIDMSTDFMSNLRREPGAFFFYLMTSYLTVLSMSGIFRSIASASRTLSQAMVPAAILILALVMFTGFVIPIDYMLGWCRWLNYVDPVAYAFEALMINEVRHK